MMHKGTVRLEGNKIVLRPFEMNDLMSIYENCWHYMTFGNGQIISQ